MVKATKPKIDYWKRNCFTCANFRRTKLLHEGKDDGSVLFQCSLNDADVVPYKVDGCRKYVNGAPTTVQRESELKAAADAE